MFGAELSFAQQNEQTYEFEPDCRNASHQLRMLVALRITHLVVHRLVEGKPPAPAGEISHKLGVPIRLTKKMLHELTEAGILCPTKRDEEQDPGYLPAHPIEKLTVARVINTIETKGATTLPFIGSESLEKLKKCLARFREEIESAPANSPIHEI